MCMGGGEFLVILSLVSQQNERKGFGAQTWWRSSLQGKPVRVKKARQEGLPIIWSLVKSRLGLMHGGHRAERPEFSGVKT